MITPYLKPFNTQGGTLYVFPSVSADLTKTFVSNEYEFKFSHFACLNIPDIYAGKYSDESEDMPKGIYLETFMDSQHPVTYTVDGMGNALAENLQNYVMNFETAIFNGEGDNDDYDSDILTTVSEKVFWNWLQKVGGIKFENSGNIEAYGSLAERTVQYIGNIDVMNLVEYNGKVKSGTSSNVNSEEETYAFGDVFEELYIHIPSTAGASSVVYFRTGEMTDNKNYLDKNYVIGGDKYIIGSSARSDNDGEYTKYGLLRKSFVDNDFGTNIYTGDIGHTIDFRDSNYDKGEGINNMNSKSMEDFEFNAVLIYYDLYQKTSDPNVKKVATNLYGILFLDQVSDPKEGVSTETDVQGYFQRYPKKKETVYGNGNSYALKIDLKIDTIGDTTGEKVQIPDFGNLTAMTMYTKAIEQLQKCIDMFYTQEVAIKKLSQRIDTLENLVMGIDSVSLMRDDINRLYNIYEGNAMVDTAAILGLIDANSKKLDTIMNGGKDLKLQYDTDVIQPGVGIGIQKSLNKVVINSEQKYSINTVYDGRLDDDTEISSNNAIKTTDEVKLCRIPLRPGENFAVLYINDLGDSTTNLQINIDDSNCDWTVGQSLKLYFVCEDGGRLTFANEENTGIIIKPTTASTLSILGKEFAGNNFIEVVCVSEDSNGEKKFIYVIK